MTPLSLPAAETWSLWITGDAHGSWPAGPEQTLQWTNILEACHLLTPGLGESSFLAFKLFPLELNSLACCEPSSVPRVERGVYRRKPPGQDIELWESHKELKKGPQLCVTNNKDKRYSDTGQPMCVTACGQDSWRSHIDFACFLAVPRLSCGMWDLYLWQCGI